MELNKIFKMTTFIMEAMEIRYRYFFK